MSFPVRIGNQGCCRCLLLGNPKELAKHIEASQLLRDVGPHERMGALASECGTAAGVAARQLLQIVVQVFIQSPPLPPFIPVTMPILLQTHWHRTHR